MSASISGSVSGNSTTPLLLQAGLLPGTSPAIAATPTAAMNTSSSAAMDTSSLAAVSSALSHMEMDSNNHETPCAPVAALTPNNDRMRRIANSIEIIGATIANLAEAIASSHEDNPNLANWRTAIANKTKDLSFLEKNFKTLRALDNDALDSSSGLTKYTSLVPRDLQPFQWEGHVHARDRGTVFVDIDECLQYFQDIVVRSRLDIDYNFVRLLPPLLSTTTRIWFTDYLTGIQNTYQRQPTWSEFCVAIKQRYGLNIIQERKNAAKAISTISMLPGETIEQFIDRFNSLRRRANNQVLSDALLLDAFGQALPGDMYIQLSNASMFLPDNQKNNVDFMMATAKESYNNHFGINARRTPKRPRDRDDSVADSVRGSSHSKWASPPATKVSRNNKAKTSNKFCSFHRVTTHNTAECRAAAATTGKTTSGSTSSAAVTASSNPCRRCGVPYTKGHQCNTAIRTEVPRFAGLNISSVAPTLAASEIAQSPVATASAVASTSTSASASTSTVANTDTDMEEASAIMIAEQAQRCKSHHIFSEPPKHKSNMITFPIILESIKTYGMLDSGATVSMVSPAFVSAIGKTPIPISTSEASFIQLGHSQVTKPRLGTVNLDLFYNKKLVNHTFEVFDIFTTLNNANIPCLVGMDLMSKLNIGITGLVLSHFDIEQSTPFPPTSIDPASLKPNDSPYGTPSDRLLMEETLNHLFKENSEIDIKNTYCNLPGAVVSLRTKPGCVAFKKQYPQPLAYKEAVLAQITKWSDEGVIEPAPSHTGFNAPLLVISKKDPVSGIYSFDKPRVVLDVRNLNSILEVTDTQSLPLIAEIHAKIGTASIFTVLDIRACFNSFLVNPEDKHKLSFTCPYTNRQYRFVKMCFGITHMSSIVQRVLQQLFHDLPQVQVYVDDLSICTDGPLASHTECVAEVLRRLTRANLVVSQDKVVLAQTSIHLLGWTLVNGALTPDPRKVNTALDFKLPTTTRALNSYLGYMNYFRSAIPMYSHISSCLDKLRNVKDITEHWTDVHTHAFNNLKQALASAPLIYPISYAYPLFLATDASNTGISGVLYYLKDNKVHYVAMASRQLSTTESFYSTTRREILAIVYCFTRFQKWLVNKRFTLLTDHRSLIYLHSQEVPNHLMLTYYEVLFSLSYDIVHLPGHLNHIADAGSRLFEDEYSNLQGGKLVDENISSFIVKRKQRKNNTSATKPYFKNNATTNQSRNNISRDQKCVRKVRNKKKFKPQLSISSTFYKKALKNNSKMFALNTSHNAISTSSINDSHSNRAITTGTNNEPLLINRALQYADYITPPRKDRDNIINKAHLLGHFGITAVETTIHKDYNMHWTNMRSDIQRIIANCDACSHYNIAKVGYHPFRSVLPDQPLDHWSMDLGTFSTTSASGNNFMLVMVDHFSRFTILRALPDKSALTIAKELLNIFCLFSFPRVLTSDRGNEFIAEIVSQMILLAGIDKRVSLPYTPQGNSVCERFVGIAKSSIIKMLNGKRDDWDLYLNGVQLAMNIKYSSLHKSRPYAIVFNRQPNGFEDYSKVTPTLSTEKADAKLIEDRLRFAQEVVIPQISKRIKETQDKQHETFSKTHKVLTDMYPIGSKVMIQNVTRGDKLEERYSGPFFVKGYTKHKSYILVDQADNLLSRDIPTQQIKLIDANKPSQNEIKDGHYEVQAIIKHRGTPANYEYLVHWLGYDHPKYHTWQVESDFDSKYHIKLYWDRRNADTADHSKIPTINNASRKKVNRDRHANKNKTLLKRSQRLLNKQRK